MREISELARVAQLAGHMMDEGLPLVAASCSQGPHPVCTVSPPLAFAPLLRCPSFRSAHQILPKGLESLKGGPSGPGVRSHCLLSPSLAKVLT